MKDTKTSHPTWMEFMEECAKLPVEECVTKIMASLTADERTDVMAHFCKHCGSDDPTCQCWNDE